MTPHASGRLASVAVVIAAAAMLLASWLHFQVQKSRAESVRISCEEQNERHDDTLAALDRLYRQRAPELSARDRERMLQSRAGTVLIIEALVPKRRCDDLIKQLVR